MKCDKCIHKIVCKFRKFENLNVCACYVEVNDPDDFIIKGDIDDIKHHPVIKAFKVEETRVIYTPNPPNIQIKAIPTKSNTLCEKCIYYVYTHCKMDDVECHACNMFNYKKMKCNCNLIKFGEPCRHFKRKESGADNGK